MQLLLAALCAFFAFLFVRTECICARGTVLQPEEAKICKLGVSHFDFAHIVEPKREIWLIEYNNQIKFCNWQHCSVFID